MEGRKQRMMPRLGWAAALLVAALGFGCGGEVGMCTTETDGSFSASRADCDLLGGYWLPEGEGITGL